MHWWVGMLLHAVCVFLFFFFKGEKKLVEILTWVVPNTRFSQHGAVDLDYIPFMPSRDFICPTFCSSNIVPALVQRGWRGTTLFFFCLSTTPQLACFFLSYYTPFISHNQVIFEFILVLIPSYLDLNDRRKWAVTVFMYCWQLLLCGNLGSI